MHQNTYTCFVTSMTFFFGERLIAWMWLLTPKQGSVHHSLPDTLSPKALKRHTNPALPESSSFIQGARRTKLCLLPLVLLSQLSRLLFRIFSPKSLDPLSAKGEWKLTHKLILWIHVSTLYKIGYAKAYVAQVGSLHESETHSLAATSALCAAGRFWTTGWNNRCNLFFFFFFLI